MKSDEEVLHCYSVEDPGRPSGYDTVICRVDGRSPDGLFKTYTWRGGERVYSGWVVQNRRLAHVPKEADADAMGAISDS